MTKFYQKYTPKRIKQHFFKKGSGSMANPHSMRMEKPVKMLPHPHEKFCIRQCLISKLIMASPLCFHFILCTWHICVVILHLGFKYHSTST